MKFSLLFIGHVFWTRHPKRYVTQFWQFRTSRASRQLTLWNITLPYQKYTFSERKFHEESKYGIRMREDEVQRFCDQFYLDFEGPKMKKIKDPYFFNLSSYLRFQIIFEFLLKFPFRICITLGGFSLSFFLYKNMQIPNMNNGQL